MGWITDPASAPCIVEEKSYREERISIGGGGTPSAYRREITDVRQRYVNMTLAAAESKAGTLRGLDDTCTAVVRRQNEAGAYLVEHTATEYGAWSEL
jgi:hypothetical protein